MTFHYGLTQIINESTHILKGSSCIDLVFTSQPNMVLDSRVHSSLHPNSHHQIVFDKFDLTFFILHLTKGMFGITNMQMLLKSKMHFDFSTEDKHFLIALSIRRFLFLMKQLSMLWVIIFSAKQRCLMNRIRLGWMRKLRI